MHEVVVEERVDVDGGLSAFLDVLWDFSRVPEVSADVVKVVLSDHVTVAERESSWSVMFRGGTINWTERDRLDQENARVTFDCVSGDFAVFEGDWTVRQEDTELLVTFRLNLDMGIPSMAGMLEPLAGKAVQRIIRDMIKGAATA